jgi:general secretion pathway protein C
MNVDRFVRRHYALLVGVCITVAAYVQAWALRRLLSSELLRPRVTAPATTPAVFVEIDGKLQKSAGPILDRDPFSSLPRALDPVLVPPAAGHGAGDPACEGVRVVLIAAAASPVEGAWSFAALAGADGTAVLRREGDELDGRTVVGIGPEDVWLARSGQRCRARLGAPGGVSSAAAPPATPTRPTLAPELAAAIRRMPDGTVEIDRSAVPTLRDRALDLTRGARIVPDGEGVRISGIRPDSLLAALGVQNGDRLVRIGGADVRNPTAMLGLLARATDLPELSMEMVRGGQRRETTIRFR